MPKNIVICCDGTSNEFDGDRTNVVKLYQMLVHDPKVQVTYYHPGLGTMEAAGALTAFSRWWTKLAGFAFGYGLKHDIRDAYVFLMNHYEKGDKIFLFGFSRGAYTARAVASLVHMVGLIRSGNEPLVPYAIRMMKNAGRSDGGKAFGRALMVSQQFKLTFSSIACRLHFVGVWDTVNSVGWIGNPLRLPYTTHNPSIEVGRHAVAIDERRAFFRENLWRPKAKNPTGPKDLLQVWFPGTHGDVGGGYPERESGLAKVSLEWMVREAQAEGLLLLPEREARIMGRAGGNYVAPDATAPLHDSLRGFLWRMAQLVPKKQWERRAIDGADVWVQRRKINLSGRRKIPDGAHVHEAAFQRGDKYIDNLPHDAVRVTTLPAPHTDQRYAQELKKVRA